MDSARIQTLRRLSYYLVCTVFYFVFVYKYFFLHESNLAGQSYIEVADCTLSCDPVCFLHLPPPREVLDCSTCASVESDMLKGYLAQLLRAHNKSDPGTSGIKGLNHQSWTQ